MYKNLRLKGPYQGPMVPTIERRQRGGSSAPEDEAVKEYTIHPGITLKGSVAQKDPRIYTVKNGISIVKDDNVI